MSAADDILGQIPLAQLASQLGVDERTAQQAVRQALPALLGGMQANAQDEGGAASLAEAIGQHDSGLLDGGVDLDQVDTGDGAKIVRHVFGGNTDQVVNQLGSVGDMGKGLVQKLLPILAPIVMAYLAKKFSGGGQQDSGQQDSGQGGGLGGGLGDLLGSVLGGGGGGGNNQAGGGLGGALGDLLGGLLGGGRK